MSSKKLLKPAPESTAAREVVGTPPPQEADLSFPIVGIGTSAGGLDALERFFCHVPEKSGLAFVVVQHMDPTREGMLVELLQRSIPLEVVQVQDRMRIEPDKVYVIPPNKDMSILHRVLHLLAPAEPHGLRLPIDFFFRSLAADQKGLGIGVILTGMGSDGTLGMGAIREQGGAVFVQSPGSAKFDGMPRSVIDAGHADVVAPVEELAARIIAYLAHTPHVAGPERAISPGIEGELEKVCVLLRAGTGHDFSQYKRNTLHRRIERRMGLHQLDTLSGYVRYLRDSPQETKLLFKELLIGVTSFFRDPLAWEHLQTEVLPALFSQRAAGGVLRAWVPGCSTGEEAYSLAMAFKEALVRARPAPSFSLQIFATDLDKDAIDRARQGVYPANIAGDVSEERLHRFFVEEGAGYRVGPEIREAVLFAPQNVIMDPPFTKLDLLSCRNLLIYLQPAVQKKLLPLFHYSLNPGGVLFLGSAETVGVASELFAPLGSDARTYRRVESSMQAPQVEFPSSFRGRPQAAESHAASPSQAPNLQALADRVLLERFSPAAVLTTAQGDILYISGRTGRYLEPAAGKANWNILAMAREGLRQELSGAFQHGLRERSPVVLSGLELQEGGDGLRVDVTVEPLQQPAALRGMVMVVFTDMPTPSPGPRPRKARQTPAVVARLEQELRRAGEVLQATREQMQASQEELRSANEELQSTNEELQSTNEELTTSKEEMQSLNEELQTVNQELQAKLDELSHANDDMRNLLESTDIATLFLDDALRVRRFTAQTTKIIKLIPGDIGRPITDLSSNLIYPKLAADTRAVLRTLVFAETPTKTIDGRWYMVRIMPYRTLDNRIDGVVITFTDITAAKALEATLRETSGEQE